MKSENCIRLTWIGFLSYAFTGALVIVTGIVLGNIADYFGLSPSKMSSTFTFLNTGILTAIFMNAWLTEIVSLRTQLYSGFSLLLLALLGLVFIHNLVIFSISMFLLGLVGGMTMSVGTLLITHLYKGRQRGSRLLFTDSFFSMAGMIFPIVAVFLLTHHIAWYWIYVCIGFIYFAIFSLALSCEFPSISCNNLEFSSKIQQGENWGASVCFLGIAAFCYILGQMGFISWVPEYAKSRGLSIAVQGKLVSDFWVCYMFGMWAISAILRFFDPQRILVFLTLVSTFLMYCFIISSAEHMRYIIMILGFFSSAIYTTIITLGSLQTQKVTPKIINFILTCGTTGTMLTFIVTGPIVAKYGTQAALFTANGLYAIVALMCFMLGFFTKHHSNMSSSH